MYDLYSPLQKWLALSLLLFLCMPCMAQRGVFLTQQDFLKQAFTQVPSSKTYWFTPEDRTTAEAIAGHSLPLRIRYFQSGERTAWILEEIGKELPITLGIVIEQQKIQLLRVMEYREVRGGEVRYDFFVQQFNNATLTQPNHKLNKDIDGISGATLSVRALTKSARLALFISRQANAAELQSAKLGH